VTVTRPVSEQPAGYSEASMGGDFVIDLSTPKQGVVTVNPTNLITG